MQSDSQMVSKISNRSIPEITLLRVMATIFVVVFHSVCYYGIWDKFFGTHDIYFYSTTVTWLNFVNMPLFVFMSGYVFAYGFYGGKYNDKMHFILNKAKRLLIPFLFFGVVNCVLFNSYCKFSLFSSFLHLWFLEMLFGVFILAIITTKLWNNKNQYITILFFLISLLIIPTTLLFLYLPNFVDFRTNTLMDGTYIGYCITSFLAILGWNALFKYLEMNKIK